MRKHSKTVKLIEVLVVISIFALGFVIYYADQVFQLQRILEQL